MSTVTWDAISQFVQERSLPAWYVREIVRAEECDLSDEEVIALYSPGVAAATLAYREWEGAV